MEISITATCLAKSGESIVRKPFFLPQATQPFAFGIALWYKSQIFDTRMRLWLPNTQDSSNKGMAPRN